MVTATMDAALNMKQVHLAGANSHAQATAVRRECSQVGITFESPSPHEFSRGSIPNLNESSVDEPQTRSICIEHRMGGFSREFPRLSGQPGQPIERQETRPSFSSSL
jgi:hypothetical protein